MPPASAPDKRSGWRTLRLSLRRLYHGHSVTAVRFRLAVIAVDLVLVAFFIAAPLLRETQSFLFIDYALAFVLAVDLAARAVAWRSIASWLKRPIVWVDLFVLLTLLAPLWFFNLAFLRVLRIWTLFNSEFFWNTVGRRYDDTRWEEVIRSVATLFTVVFVITGFVYTIYVGKEGGAVEGFILRGMAPLYVGTLGGDGKLALETIIPDLNRASTKPIATVEGLKAWDTMVVENLVSGARGCGYISPEGTVRASAESCSASCCRSVYGVAQ